MPVELTCEVCGEKYLTRPSKAARSKCCSYKCKQILCGRKGGAVTGEYMKRKSKGKTYTKTGGRHAHRVTMERLLGRPLEKGEIVHHRDGNKLNNSPENLELMTQPTHIRRHIYEMLARRKEKHGY